MTATFVTATSVENAVENACPASETTSSGLGVETCDVEIFFQVNAWNFFVSLLEILTSLNLCHDGQACDQVGDLDGSPLSQH